MKKVLLFAMTALICIFVTAQVAAETVSDNINGFDFDGNYDEYSGFTYDFDITNGVRNSVKNGRLSTVCTAGKTVTFNSPDVQIPNLGYMVFAVQASSANPGAAVEVTVNGYPYPELSLNGVSNNVFAINLNDIASTIRSFSIHIDSVSVDESEYTVYLDYVHFTDDITVNYDIEKYCTVFSAFSEKINIETSEEEYVAFVTSYGDKDRFSGAKMFKNEAVTAKVAESAKKAKVFFFESASNLTPFGEALNITMICEFSEWV